MCFYHGINLLKDASFTYDQRYCTFCLWSLREEFLWIICYWWWSEVIFYHFFGLLLSLSFHRYCFLLLLIVALCCQMAWRNLVISGNINSLVQKNLFLLLAKQNFTGPLLCDLHSIVEIPITESRWPDDILGHPYIWKDCIYISTVHLLLYYNCKYNLNIFDHKIILENSSSIFFISYFNLGLITYYWHSIHHWIVLGMGLNQLSI